VVVAGVRAGGAIGAIARWRTPLLVAVLLMLLIALIISGQWPELRSKVSFTPNGVVTIAPAEVRRVEIRSGSDSIALLRQANSWSIDGLDRTAPAEFKAHLDTALRLVNVSEPAREIPASELTAASFAAFGLDPPATVAVIEAGGGLAAIVNFGALNPASTSHYVRLAGRPAVYLMPRHVGEEWRVTFDMARRLRGQSHPNVVSRGKGLLLPVSMAQVWALEIVSTGKLTRFERMPLETGSAISASTATRPVMSPMLPIPSRPASSMRRCTSSMPVSSRRGSGLPTPRNWPGMASTCRA
jgi:hypothetical protein